MSLKKFILYCVSMFLNIFCGKCNIAITREVVAIITLTESDNTSTTATNGSDNTSTATNGSDDTIITNNKKTNPTDPFTQKRSLNLLSLNSNN